MKINWKKLIELLDEETASMFEEYCWAGYRDKAAWMRLININLEKRLELMKHIK